MPLETLEGDAITEGLQEAATEINHSARRINALKEKLNPRRYLEVGVASGGTFFSVDIPSKTAVDPRFRFDWRSKQTEDVRFFEMPSDTWFVNHSEGEVFDFIFLDGLHTFEQTFRDFCNTISLAHDRTVWIIDDTVPIDVYSAWPHQREAVEFRREASGRAKARGAWSGDVYKVIFAIHDFFPGMSFCTIVTGGNPQTIVWRQRRPQFTPLFNNLETISRLNFFDFKKNFEALHGKPEQEALDEVLKFFSTR